MGAPSIAWLAQLQAALAEGTQTAGAGATAAVLRAAAAAIERTGQPLGCRIVPSVPGHRPTHEGAHPGLGSSEEIAVIVEGGQDDPACVLYALPGAGLPGVEVFATLSFTGPDGRMAPV